MSPPAQKARSPAPRIDDTFDVVVVCPGVELRLHRQAHVMRQRIQRLRPVERDEADGAALFEQDFGFVRHCRNISRATITRMISLVPSRI